MIIINKLIVAISAFVVFFFVATSSTFATYVPGDVGYSNILRIGLTSKLNEVWSISTSNQSITLGYENTNGFFVAEFTLNSPSGFTFTSDSSYYIKVGNFSNYTEAKAHSDALLQIGHKAAPCLISTGSWSVYAGGFETQALAVSSGINGTIMAPNARRIVLLTQNTALAIFDSPNNFPQFAAQGGGNISLGNSSYRNRIEIARFGGKNLTAVNIIGLEEYLYSVTPSEAPSQWHIEMLKAQSIACRSYTVNRKGVHSENGYDLCDSQHCQVYIGVGSESALTTQAVISTKDIFAYYNDKPISAVYFSSSGGYTDNSENVWSNAEPYLRSVADTYEKDAKEWSRTFTLEDLDKALSSNSVSIGKATGMHISRTENNRVQELVVSGTTGNHILKKEDIRTFFSSLSGGSLESRNFTLNSSANAYETTSSTTIFTVNSDGALTEQNIGNVTVINSQGAILPVNIIGNTINTKSAYNQLNYVISGQGPYVPSDNSGTFVLTGKGNGHGVGMSQYGAKAMAESGSTYEQILKWYYTGIELR